MHHIISDGWSMGVLMREVSALYNTIVNDHEQPLPLLKIQYKDFSVWQNQQLQGEALRKHREYWYKQFESEVPVLQLPYDFQRPKMKSYNGDILAFTVSPGLSQEVIALGRARDATLFMILLASVKALLYRYSHQEDMIIGSPLSGRQNRQLEDQIGFYVNTLALRTTFKGSDSFAQLLDQVKVVTLAAFDHEVYPFDQLVDDLELRRDTSRSPLFDVMVGLNMDISDIPHQGMEGTHIDGYEVDSRISKYDLLFAFTHLPEGIQVTVEYNSDLFLPQRIQRMAGHYRGLLQAIVKDTQTPLNRLDYLSPTEKHQLLHQFARASTDMPMEKTFNDYLQQQEPVEVELWLNTPGFSRYILDPALNPLPIGVDGDIWIGGPAMSPEDDNLPGDTTGRLIDNPFATDTAEMLFHTGARGRYLEDGHIAVTEKETDPSQQHRQDSEPEMFIEPRTDMEQQIAAAWKKVLGVETIGIHSDFFQIGGNSLKGLTAIQEINETLHLNLLITHIFEHPTVEKFSAYLEDISDSPGLETSRPQSIENIEMREYYDISHAQKRLWVVCQFPESSMAYNMPGGYILSGQLQPDALVKAFELLVERHEILRTIFITVEDKPKQKILSKDKTGFTFDTLDLGKNAHREEQARQLVNREARTAFDLNNGPLVRAKLIRLQEDKYLFLFNMHHIISDGWSLGVMIREISALYNAIVNDHDQPLPLLKIQYKDFSSWQNEQLQGEALNKHRQYWLKQMSQPIPVLELPYDNPRPRVKTFNGDVIGFLLSPGLTSQINQVALAHETSLFITLLASVQALLYRYTGQEDMIVGSPVSGRGHRVLENQVGFYVNMLALRTSFKGSHGFKALLNKVKKICLAAYEHDVYPFDRLVDDLDLERDMSRSPLFDVLVSLNPEIETLPGETFEKVTLENYALDPKISKFDLFFAFSQLPEGLYVTIEYNTDLFHRSRIRRMVDHYRLLLDSLVTDVQTPLHELNYLSPSEKHRILVEFNDTRREYPGDGTIAQLFAEEAARSPETVALVGVSASAPTVMHVTYRELEQKSRQLAYWLEANGLCPDMDIIVAIMVERSVEMALGILGILMAGAAYLPIDSEYPRERIRYMLADSDARMLLSQESEIGQVIGENPPMVLEINKSLAAFTSPLPPSHPQASLTAFSPSAQLAYILYTSGTTGNPKAVMIEQHSVIRLVKNTNFIEFEKGDRILQTGALDFDASTLEIWGSLLNGLQLHLESKDTLLNPHRLKEAVRKHIISTMWMTAPLFNRMVDEDIEIFSGLRNLLVGGDVLSPAHIRQVREKSPILKVINGYGPTENTTFSTTFSIDKDYETNIPIGKPIANSTAYILDKHRQLVPIGVFGELVVGGDGVARGYLNNPELTAEKFILAHSSWLIADRKEKQRDFGSVDDSKALPMSYELSAMSCFYKTGDLARWLPNGNIDFLGRTDQQVKIRGFRIELAEIENHLVKHDQIKEALVIARQGTAADKYLCAYIVPAKEKELSPLQLRKFLQDRLPGYMIPAYFIFLDGFPLTPNGKIQRQALPDPGTEYPGTDVQLAAPRNAVEEKLVEIWAAVLNRNNVGIDDDFFVVGGDSIKAIQVASRMNKASYKVDIKDIYQYPTISELAPIVRPSRQEAESVDKGPFYPGKGFELTGVLEKLPDRYDFEITDIYPLTPMQEGMLFHSLVTKNSSIYFEQFSYRLHGHLDITLLEKSLNRLFQRYDILRTAFIHQDIDRPVQVVLANRPAEFSFKDICDRTDKEKENFIRQYKNKDIQRSFDLEKDALMRVLLIKVKESLYQFTWSFHHILLDGWCIGILTSDFFEFYNSMLENRECRLMPVKPYREYILWLEKQDKKEAERFWEKYLQNYNESAYISAMTQRKATGEEYKDQRFTFALDSETTNQLKQLAGRNRVTVNTVFQVLWGIILAKYTGKQDVVFGAVVSGRPAELEGVETMVGLFINTVPVRIRLEKNAVFKQVLKKVQQETLQCEPFHYYPLSRIQAKSPLKQELLDHILVFENFPAAEQIDGLLLQSETGTEKSKTGTLTVSDVQEFGLSNYDFNIIIGQRETTDIIFSYNAHVYERKFVQQIAGHLNKLIEQVLTNHHIEIDDLTILDEKEISQLIKMIRNESDKSFIRDLEQQDGIEAELEANFDF
jgi:amino acid adenylation domain-containing protein